MRALIYMKQLIHKGKVYKQQQEFFPKDVLCKLHTFCGGGWLCVVDGGIGSCCGGGYIYLGKPTGLWEQFVENTNQLH